MSPSTQGSPGAEPASGPLLITGFSPNLDDPKILADQVQALEAQIGNAPDAVVLLTQASYGSLIRRREEANERGELGIASPLRRLINLLAPFSVYLGHDVDVVRADERGCDYDKQFAYKLQPEAKERGAKLRSWRNPFPEQIVRLRERRLYLARRRLLYELLYEEGKPTRQLQRIALRLFNVPEDDACTVDQVVSHFGLAAGPYYEAIWASCDVEERLVLAQLAWEGVANPKAYDTILDLLHKELIRRDPTLRLINRSFEKFVRRALPRWQLVALEEESGTSAWSVLKWLLPLPLLLLGGFLFLTQQDAVSNVIGLAIAIGSLVPTFVNFYQKFQQPRIARTSRTG